MPVARSTRETFPFVTEADRQLSKDKQTTFHLRQLSTRTMLALRDLREGDEAAVGKWLIVALRAGLVGWENFCDSTGAAVEFTLDKKARFVHGVLIEHAAASEASIEYLSPQDAQEIGLAIMRGNTLSLDEVGN
jgi:hypothetical protein